MLLIVILSCILAAFSSVSSKCPDSDVQELWAGNAKFSARMYKELVKTKKNFISSPISVEIVLGITEVGARGQTSQELIEGLNFPSTQEKTESAFRKVLSDIIPHNTTMKLLYANKIYVKDGFPIKEVFKNESVVVFMVQTENLDFDNKQNAANTINSWVEQQTNNRIQNLISPNDLNSDTRLVLVNALYFLGNWTMPFGKTRELQTRKEQFFTSLTTSVKVDMMHSRGQFGYYESVEYQAKFLELPYEGGATMVIILPEKIDGLEQLENNLEELLKPQYFTKEFLEVGLPRWKTESTIDFNEILQNLGVKTIFTNSADLSGISKYPLKVSKVVQKAFINVTEAGTEAAAATAVTVQRQLAVLVTPPVPQFIVDHPFLYYIEYKDLILFIGRILSPNV